MDDLKLHYPVREEEDERRGMEMLVVMFIFAAGFISGGSFALLKLIL